MTFSFDFLCLTSVTGESGAGKTETVKIVMSHIARIPQTRPTETGSSTCSKQAMKVVTRVCESAPIFEAFGNAKTLSNDNSSRFGRLIQLQFEIEKRNDSNVQYADLVGSRCTSYLLEKSRVVSHNSGERTYHIFYQLLNASREFKSQLWPHFAECKESDFKYISESGNLTTKGYSDLTMWDETKESLALFQFQGESLLVLMRTLGIILQLGNLSFDQDDASDHEDEAASISSTAELERLTEMIGIDGVELENSMTRRTLKTSTEQLQVKATPQVAKDWCDALAKEIYSRLFDIIVRRINLFTAAAETKGGIKKIGHVSLLDIFGFENFDVNQFEQLCINYVSEKIQHKFILDNFNKIKVEYDMEGIDFCDFSIVDNSTTLELFEGSSGLINALNEECHLPSGRKDKSFVSKVRKVHKGTKGFIHKKLSKKTEFGVRHFAGEVVYDAHQFVERNMDKLPDGLVECAAKSTNSLIRAEFETLLKSYATAIPEKRASIRRDRFVLEKFQSQLRSLIGALENTRTFYIRCIKPNKTFEPLKTDQQCVIQQLKCSGIMTAVAITREIFPDVLSLEFILARYACLMQGKDSKDGGDSIDKVQACLIEHLKPLSRENRDGSVTSPFSCGKTKVYFKAGAKEFLETLRSQVRNRYAVVVQTWWRMQKQKNCFHVARKAIITLQRRRRLLVKLRMHAAATSIQSLYRKWVCVEKYKVVRNAALAIQARTKGRYRKIVCANKLSAWMRGLIALRLVEELRHQRDMENAIKRAKLKRETDAATVIALAYRCFVARRVVQGEKQDMQTAARLRGDQSNKADEPDSWIQRYASHSNPFWRMQSDCR